MANLRRIGDDASIAVPKLTEIAKHPHTYRKYRAIGMLAFFEEWPAVIEVLINDLTSDDIEVKKAAINETRLLKDAPDISLIVAILYSMLDEVPENQIRG